jgi:hypothetical protein
MTEIAHTTARSSRLPGWLVWMPGPHARQRLRATASPVHPAGSIDWYLTGYVPHPQAYPAPVTNR